MAAATKYVTAENRVATSDPRFDMRMTNNFDDDDAPGSGWAWVGAILVAGVLIVSGYLDQESINAGSVAASAVDQRYASNTSATPAGAEVVNRSGHRSDKGY